MPDKKLFTFGQIPLSTIHTSIFYEITSASAYFNLLIEDRNYLINLPILTIRNKKNNVSFYFFYNRYYYK